MLALAVAWIFFWIESDGKHQAYDCSPPVDDALQVPDCENKWIGAIARDRALPEASTPKRRAPPRRNLLFDSPFAAALDQASNQPDDKGVFAKTT